VYRILVGNKCDLGDKREVTTQEGQDLADFYGMTFIEASAKDTINISESFFTMAKGVVEKMTRNQDATRENEIKMDEIHSKERKNAKKKCC
jgi:GTPase SAR1 family protein